MPPKIITADERLAETHIKGAIFGPAKIGKTSLLHTLPPESTLFVDLEGGGLSVKDWPGDSIKVENWEQARDLACFFAGPTPEFINGMPYSYEHYNRILPDFQPLAQWDKYKTLFYDSITVAGRHSFQWCTTQPEATTKSGEKNTMGIYGLHGLEMTRWLTRLQHIPNRHVWLVGLLDAKQNEFNQTVYSLQIEGSKAGLELPGIVDEVISMIGTLDQNTGELKRTFVCQQLNPWGVPAGDRSGKLDPIERPHLGDLMTKILAPQEQKQSFDYSIPQNK